MDAALLPCGEQAVLVELSGTDAAMAAAAEIGRLRETGADPWRRLVDVVPGARTVLVTFDHPLAGSAVPQAIRDALAAMRVEVAVGPAGTLVVPCRYDGPDLGVVAELTGLSVAGVVDAHTSAVWRVAFGGFAPGFAYLVGGPSLLHVPRREVPRASVPAGAVGLAGDYTGIYPRSSPGGWRLIGWTDLVLWDAERRPPALLTPGTDVRFEAVP